MKRSEALNLIANQLDYLNGTFEGARKSFTKEELANADVILTTLLCAGMLPPPHYRRITDEELKSINNTKTSYYSRQQKSFNWEPEND